MSDTFGVEVLNVFAGIETPGSHNIIRLCVASATVALVIRRYATRPWV